MLALLIAATLQIQPKLIQSYEAGGPVLLTKFSRDGKSVVSFEANGGGFDLHDLSTGKRKKYVHMGGRVRMASFSTQKQILLSIRADYDPSGNDIRSLVTATSSSDWTPSKEPTPGGKVLLD